MTVVGAVAATIVLAACPRSAPEQPRPRGAGWVRSFAADGPAAVRGVDVDDAGVVYTAVERDRLEIAAVTGPTAPPRWTWTVAAAGGPIAVAGARVAAAIATGAGAPIDVGGRSIAVRGEPGAALIGLDAATGAVAWVVPVGATGWAVISAIDGHADGDVVAVGSFAGTLRAGDHTVTAAGSSDGFAVRVGPGGDVRWLARVGGDSADALTAVAIATTGLDRVAVAGSFTGAADFRGTALVAGDPRVATTDVMVVVLDGRGLPRWGRVLGGDGQDSAAGVAILGDGAVAVAATVREVVHVAGETHVARGASDALIAVYDAAGAPIASRLIGGRDHDGARGLAVAPGDALVVAGWFAGTLPTPTGDAIAGGGDDAFIAHLDRGGALRAIEVVTGAGREEVTGVAASRAGVAIGIGYTAAVTVAGVALPAPAGPGGAAVVFQP